MKDPNCCTNRIFLSIPPLLSLHRPRLLRTQVVSEAKPPDTPTTAGEDALVAAYLRPRARGAA